MGRNIVVGQLSTAGGKNEDLKGTCGGHELQVVPVRPSTGITRGDLPAFSGRVASSQQASRLDLPASAGMPGLRLRAIRCPGRRIEGDARESLGLKFNAAIHSGAEELLVLKSLFDTGPKLSSGI